MTKVHYVYKITNIVDGKFYIGKHYGFVNDAYMGSGKYIKAAILKYGPAMFIKEVLGVFDDGYSSHEYETQLIREGKLWSDVQSYNISPNFDFPNGYIGGVTYEDMFGAEKAAELKQSRSQLHKGKIVSDCTKKKQSNAKVGTIPWNKGKTAGTDPRVAELIKQQKMTRNLNPTPPWNKGLSGEEYTKRYVDGGITPPSMIGRIWINNGAEQRKIMKGDIIPDGWVRGRCDNKGSNNPMNKGKQNENKENNNN